ncbi:MAG: hypothetical protein QOE51_2614 [Actinoplanes sp.]|jgi:NADPH-dependent 2,4-dienoyl-CoA reductase/sulfur reductase-like enzyme|nr:hypothetical protein [Actinoplanes sp.]
MSRIAIVGAGVAGLRAAERLRELGQDDEIVILGSEDTMPYHRPALIKQFLVGEQSAAEVKLEVPADLDVTWRLSTPVSHLDAHHRVLHLPGGEELRYDGLIIATGVEARRLNGGQHGHPRVITVRTLADIVRLQRALAGNRYPVVILGNSLTGCEVASSLRAMAREVILVGRSTSLMARLLGRELGDELVNLHRQHTVDLQLGATIDDWSLRNRSVVVRLTNGEIIQAAAVVVAAGSVPGVSWLRGSGVPVDDGVVCDPTCHVVGYDDIVAAGDVALWPNLRFDNRARRVEHWTNAIEMGRAAAENLLRGRAAAEPFMPVPRFWSEQHGVRIHAAGMPVLGTKRMKLQASSTGGRSVTGYVRQGSLMGVVGFDSSAAVLAFHDELSRQKPFLQSAAEQSQRPHRRLSFLDAARTTTR